MPKLNKYNALLQTIKSTIQYGQFTIYRKANTQLIKTYFNIGQILSAQMDNNGRGKGVVEQLSKDLADEFGPRSGYSIQNLRYMKKIYLTYKNNIKLQQLVGELPRGQNIVIMDKCETLEQKAFYINLTISKGLSRNVLIHQIEGNAYHIAQKTGQNNFEVTIPEESDLASISVKDEYLLNFLGLSEPFAERNLEQSLIENIKQFLMELGTDFCFIGNQYKLSLEENDYFVDLLFYHRSLKRLFAIELKVEEFKPEFVGKMNFYLGLLDDQIKKPDEGASIGIILCKKKNKLTVEYALRGSKSPIAIATYQIINALEKKFKHLSK